jgi:protein CpxP
MSKSKLLTFAVITLIIINIITLSFFIFKGPKDKGERNGRDPNRSPREIIVKKLHFDKDQITKYDELIKQHSESISKIDNEIILIKNNLYRELSNPENKTVTDSLFLQIASNQTGIERLHYNHFIDIKKLCIPEQLEDYNALTIELAQIFGPKLPPKDNNRELHP